MIITAYFALKGVPKIGLSPTLNIRRLDTNILVVTAGNMTEVGDGFYKYDFSGYNSSLEYSILCDGSSTLDDTERYAVGVTVNGDFTVTEKESISTLLDTLDTNIDTIISSITDQDLVLDIIRKLTGNKVTKLGDIITIYEDNGSTVWREYNISLGGRVVI